MYVMFCKVLTIVNESFYFQDDKPKWTSDPLGQTVYKSVKLIKKQLNVQGTVKDI